MIDQVESIMMNMEQVGNDKYFVDKLASIEEIKPKIDFVKTHVAVCKNGGLMAFMKKSDRFIMDSSNVIKDNIRIFCQNGKGERTIYVITIINIIFCLVSFRQKRKVCCLI